MRAYRPSGMVEPEMVEADQPEDEYRQYRLRIYASRAKVKLPLFGKPLIVPVPAEGKSVAYDGLS